MGLGQLASPQRAAVIVGLVVLLALALSGSSEAEKPVTVAAGAPEPVFNGGVAPKALPRMKRAPVEIGISGKIENPPGRTYPPRLRDVIIEGDRAVALDVSKLPACSPDELRTTQNTEAAEALCGTAIVARGTAVTGAVFPDERLISEKVKVVAFNGGDENGVTTFLIYAHLTIPAPTAIVATAKIRRVDNGIYALKALISIPQFGNGFGLTTAFDLVFERGVFLARCPTGKLQGSGTALFADGLRLNTTVFRTCKARD
jgi:hypothetical protein